MEGLGIWIFLLLFYLLQAITKNQQKKRRQEQKDQSQQQKAPRQAHRPIPQQGRQPMERQTQSSRSTQTEQDVQIPKKPHEPVSLEDFFNPDKLRDILGVPQPKPVEKPIPTPKPVTVRSKQPIVKQKIKQEIRKRWEEPAQSKPSLQHDEIRETVSRVASADITEVDETAAEFQKSRLTKSDITSDQFDVRKIAPGEKKSQIALAYFDEPKDIRNAVILKEILDRPRAFRRNIR
jgi:hypothetical protein